MNNTTDNKSMTNTQSHEAVLGLAKQILEDADALADKLVSEFGSNPARWSKADRDRLRSLNKQSSRLFREARGLVLQEINQASQARKSLKAKSKN
jgi:hypothetical protein